MNPTLQLETFLEEFYLKKSYSELFFESIKLKKNNSEITYGSNLQKELFADERKTN